MGAENKLDATELADTPSAADIEFNDSTPSDSINDDGLLDIGPTSTEDETPVRYGENLYFDQ